MLTVQAPGGAPVDIEVVLAFDPPVHVPAGPSVTVTSREVRWRPRDDDFRCLGCERVTRGGRYCDRCLAEGPGREPADARDVEGDDYTEDGGES